MSQYSEMMGSFARTGNYPLEANYIFSTLEELNTFYSDPINRTTLHIGLLRIIEEEKAIYWAIPDEDNYLYFEKLVDLNSYKDVEELKANLEKEINDRIESEFKIWGTSDPDIINSLLNNIRKLSVAILELQQETGNLKGDIKTIVGTEEDNITEYLKTLDYKNLTELSEALNKFLNTIDDEDESINTLPELQEFLRGFSYTKNLYEVFVDFWNEIQGDPTPNTLFRTLRGILDFVLQLASVCKNREDNLLTELNLTLTGVGLDSDGSFSPDLETTYLKNATSIMNALRTLDSLINLAINNCNIESEDTESVAINISREVDKTVISARIKVSPDPDNDIQIKSDGLYYNIDSEYENGILTIKVNGNIRQLHVLGLSSVVDTAYYDPTQESIIIVFKLHDGLTLTVVIPAVSLIAEWEVDNSRAGKVVELEKERNISGPDKLSADVRISTNKHNILEKDSNTLLVRGTADNIVYDGDVTVKSKLDSLVDLESSLDVAVGDINTKLSEEVNRAKIAELGLANGITNLRTDVETKDQELLNKIDLEKVRAEGVESNLDTKILTIKENIENNINAQVSSILDSLNNEITRSTTEDANFRDKLVETNTNLNNEILRASNAEALLSKDIKALQDIVGGNASEESGLKTDLENLKLLSVALQNAILLETQRATDAEQALDHRIDDIKDLSEHSQTLIETNSSDILEIKIKNSQQDSSIEALNDKIQTVKDNVETNIGTKVSSLLDTLNLEISRSTLEDTDIRSLVSELSTNIANETTRAKAEESVIRTEITSEKERATLREDFIDSRISDHINDHNNPHQVTADQINVYTKDKVNDLLENINLSHHTITNGINDSVTELKSDLSTHLIDYGNPHKVTKAQVGLDKVDNTTDLEKPISVATLEALHNRDLVIATKANLSDLLEHMFDHDNPHNVTKEQLGLDNVDNTSDMIKPISIATLMALDKKADIYHTHTMSDIVDFESVPSIKGFVEVLGELPSDPANGDKYVVTTLADSGIVKYTLCEYDATNGIWKLKLMDTGGVVSIADEDVWKLTSSGPERMLDVSDYDYFYNKIYDETKDLIEDIDWEEDDATSDTNNQIRLKITYKTSYGDPNENEVTNPFKKKAVKYIDIEKARFLSDAYSRPARLSDVDEGYATKLGEPMLILVMTTGDYVAISLKEALNIYDPIDTSSIDMEVTDWTGDPDTSYKVSATVRLATTEDKKTAVSLHINDSTEKGMYATLHTSNTNSISLNPSTGTNGTLKTLTANLNIDNQVNNNSNIVLSVSSDGLSAQFVWGDYE